jgi:hypothetical protein
MSFPPHGDNEPLYYLGQADYWRETIRLEQPAHWTAKQWTAYMDGLYEAAWQSGSDITAQMNEQHLGSV